MSNLTFNIGNIFKKDKLLYVITNVDYDNKTCTLLRFDSNELCGAPFEPKIEKHICFCTNFEDDGEFCISCGGDGFYVTTSPFSMEDFTFIAKNIRNYLIEKYVD